MQTDFKKQYPYLYSTLNLEENFPIVYDVCPAGDLLVPERFDFMAKLIYIDGIHGRFDQALAEKIYTGHIRAFGNGRIQELSNPQKKGIRAYLNTFDHILSLAADMPPGSEFILNAPLPLDGAGVALDGAHRITAAFSYRLSVPVYRLPDCRLAEAYDYLFFRRRRLEESTLLHMAKKYTELKRTALLTVSVKGLHKREFLLLEQRLREAGRLAYILYIPRRPLLILLDTGAFSKTKAAGICREFFNGRLTSLTIKEDRERVQSTLSRYLLAQKRREQHHFLYFKFRKKACYTYAALLHGVKAFLRIQGKDTP